MIPLVHIKSILEKLLITGFLIESVAFCHDNGRDGKNLIKQSRLVDNYIDPDNDRFITSYGAIIRGDTSEGKLALVFTGDEFADGGVFISETLKEHNINASFFFTGNFFRIKKFKPVVMKLLHDHNYVGAHSDRHLLYCDWNNRDSLLVTKGQFVKDMHDSYAELKKMGIKASEASFFLPPYEWYNDSISLWTSELGLQLINFTPGTRSNADYTWPGMENRYVDSRKIYNSILDYEDRSSNGLNGFILLLHIGTDSARTDKFYHYLPVLIEELKGRGYEFVRIDDLLK